MSKRTQWTDDLIAARLTSFISKLGRMPSANEIRAEGSVDLATAIARRGGYAAWQARLGVGGKQHDTATGHAVEAAAFTLLCARGYHVERQTVKAPYDLLVMRPTAGRGAVRVDVKAAHYSAKVGGGKNALDAPGGYVFALRGAAPLCDLYLLAMLDAADAVAAWFFVPSTAARVQTITLTIRGACKYDRYRDAFVELDRLIALRSIG